MRNKMTIKNREFKLKSWAVASFLTFTFLFSTATAQEALLAAGVDVSGSGGSLSYSVGQVVYQIHTGTDGSLAEGVQQPYRITVASAVEEARGIYLMFTAFPNPATKYLTLKVENFDKENLSYQVVDMHGKILDNQKITVNQTRIDMANLETSTYFVKVILDNKLVKTFKIIKS